MPPKLYTVRNALNSGEISELIAFREDISKYSSSCLTLENSIALVEGGAKKMPGTYFAGTTENGGSMFTGSIATTVLTVTAINYGVLQVGQTIVGPGVTTGTTITAFGSGTGSAGSYAISTSQTLSSEQMQTASSGKSRLVPFQFSTAQGAILEFSAGIVRIWEGATPGDWSLGLALNGPTASNYNPVTAYVAGNIVQIGPTCFILPTSGPTWGILSIAAPYGATNANTVPITLTLNSADSLVVTVTGSAPNQGINIALANTTRANNAATAIQAAIQALVSLNSGTNNYVSLAAWTVTPDTIYYATPPIVLPTTYSANWNNVSVLGECVASNQNDEYPLNVLGGWNSAYWEMYTPVAEAPIELVTPYLEADLFALDCSTQSADVLWVFHPNYPPACISRLSANSWQYSQSLAGQQPGEASYRGTLGIAKTGYSALGQSIIAVTQASFCDVSIAKTTMVFAQGSRIYINLCAGMVQLNEGEFIVFHPSTSTWFDANGNFSFALGDPQTLVSFVGSISGTVLTVTQVNYGTIQHFQGLNWDGTTGNRITSFGTGTGGVGTYNLLASSSVAAGTTFIGAVLIDSAGYIAYVGGGFAVQVSPMFAAPGDYPACGTLYQERLCVGGSDNNPTQLNGSVQDDYPDFICDPNEDDYAIQFTLVSNQVNQLINMIGTPNALLIGTSGGVWVMNGSNGSSLSQTNVNASVQSTYGVSALQPQLVNGSAIFVSRSARIVNFLVYSFTTNAWDNNDLTRLNRNITLGPSEATSGIAQTAFQIEPYPIFWAVRNDGQLIGLVFNVQDQVYAWFRVNMTIQGGSIESVAVISGENQEDQVVVVVNRTINGVTQRYVEYFMPQELFGQLSNAFFVHCGQQLQGAPAVAITGITNGSSCVVSTKTPHGFTTGMTVQITGVTGMVSPTGQSINQDATQAYTITYDSATEFTLNGMDTSTWTPYVSGGSVEQVFNEVTGLSYLLGQTVVAVGDGAIILQPTVVTSDSITFPYYCNLITIGIPYTTTIQPTNPSLSSQGATTRGMPQKLNRASLSLYQSMGGQVGTDLNYMYDLVYGTGTQLQTPTMTTGLLTVDLDCDWSESSTLYIQQSDPLPFCVRGIIFRMTANPD
jgi:hypothetical protein